MLDLISVESLEDARLQIFLEKRDYALKDSGLILADSEKVVSRLFENNIKVRRIVASAKYYERYAELFAKCSDVEKFVLDRSELQKVIGHRIHQGIMALAERPEDVGVEGLGQKVVVLNKILDPSNVGAIVRSCHAFGIDSLVVDEQSCTPYYRRAIRVSMGSIFKMKVHHTKNVVSVIEKLRSNQYQVHAAGLWKDARPIDSVQFASKSVLVMGNEHAGVNDEVLKLTDQKVYIPMEDSIDSLNVACAASILLYHFR